MFSLTLMGTLALTLACVRTCLFHLTDEFPRLPTQTTMSAARALLLFSGWTGTLVMTSVLYRMYRFLRGELGNCHARCRSRRAA